MVRQPQPSLAGLTLWNSPHVTLTKVIPRDAQKFRFIRCCLADVDRRLRPVAEHRHHYIEGFQRHGVARLFAEPNVIKG